MWLFLYYTHIHKYPHENNVHEQECTRHKVMSNEKYKVIFTVKKVNYYIVKYHIMIVQRCYNQSG